MRRLLRFFSKEGSAEHQSKPEEAFHKTIHYNRVSRDESVLLTACWNQDWGRVVSLCKSNPKETYWKSKNSGRTALHLATMPGANCPVYVLQALIDTNPYAIVERDRHKYGGTPLHFCCGSLHREDLETVRLFVDTACSVQDEIPELTTYSRSDHQFYSPLYLASKHDAPPQVINLIVRAGQQQMWIAPWTGAENHCNVPPHAWNSPLHCVFQNFQRYAKDHAELPLDRMRKIADDILQYHDEFPSLPKIADEPLLKSWANLVVLLRPSWLKSRATLLHVAAQMNRPVAGLLQTLCNVFPHQLLTPSNAGEIPLHTAILNPISPFRGPKAIEGVRPIEILLSACIGSAVQVCEVNRVRWYPAFLAAKTASADDIFLLLLCSPTVVELQKQEFATNPR